MASTAVTRLDLDLDVFAGPFDLLLALVLREELDLLEVDLAEVVLAYVDHLDARDELDLESATEFLVLIAALLELKSRLMLPGEEVEELDYLAPAEAAEELLARMLAYARYRGAGGHLAALREAEQGVRYRSAPLPPQLRRAPLEHVERAYDPAVLGQALGGLLRTPPALDLGHIAVLRVSLAERVAVLRGLLAARHVLVRRGGARRRPDDRGGHAVRAPRALQARRGDLGAGGRSARDGARRGRRAVRRRAAKAAG